MLTYRALRLAVVGLSVLLDAALAVEVVRSGGVRLASISGYYYSPVRNVLVGVLVGTGAALIAIMGRARHEDRLLDLAGMLAVLVGLVPTTIDAAHPGACGTASSCIPADALADVSVDVTALLLVGAIGLAAAVVYGVASRHGQWFRGLAAPGAVWGVLTVTWFAARGPFLSYAHTIAAFLFFCLLAWVAWINSTDPPRGPTLLPVRPSTYARWYRGISIAMWSVIGLAGAYQLALDAHLLGEVAASWYFWVETLLLVLFLAFWVLQTAHYWHIGSPRHEPATEAAEPG